MQFLLPQRRVKEDCELFMADSFSHASLAGYVTGIMHRGPIETCWNDETRSVEITIPEGSEVLEVQSGHNMIVNTGLDYIVAMLGGLQTTPAKYLALGSNNAAPAAGNTTLTSENTTGGCVRKLVTPVATGGGSGTITYTATWGQTENPSTITGEVGLFTASSSGVMIAHYAYGTPYPTKDSATSLTIVYAITAQQAS